MSPPLDRYSARVSGLRSSAIREIPRLADRPDLISLAGGLPAPELFPTARLGQVAAELLSRPTGGAALQYSATEGEAAR